MSWKDMLKFDRARKQPYEEEQAHLLSRREKRRKMGLPPTQKDRIMGTAGTSRDKRVHRMKPEDRPKPRRRATEKEQMETRRRNRPPIMRIKKREPAISSDYIRELGDIADFLVKTLDGTLTEERVAPFPEEDKENFKELTKLLDEALEIVYELKDNQEGRNFIRNMKRTTQRKSPRMGVEGGTKGRGSKRYGKGSEGFRGH